MDLKIINLILIYIFISVHQLESKIKNIKILFKKEEKLPFKQQKLSEFIYPDTFIKPMDNKQILHRIKRTSKLVKNKDPQTLLDPLQIIHPMVKPEYGMLFKHQGYFMQGLCRLYLFIAIKLPRVSDLLHDPDLMPHCHRWAEQWDVPSSQQSTTYNQKSYDEPIHQHICKELFDTYKDPMN